MKIFISSLMNDAFLPLREAASDAITMLGYKPVRAEGYPASPISAQGACLSGVRSADAVVLILGSQYGSTQASELSATHEEYREARETSRPILTFISEADQPTGQQTDFVQEVQNWEQGCYTASFRDASDLQAKVAQGLHQHLINRAATPLDQDSLKSRALELLPTHTHTGRTLLGLSIVGGPSQQVLRPAELESQQLHDYLQNEAHRNPDAVLSHSYGTAPSISGDTIILEQRDSGARVTLSETGSLTVSQPAIEHDPHRLSISAIIQEEITELVLRALRFGARVLEHVDQHQRISHVAVAAAVPGAEHLPWRTREEQNRESQRATMGFPSHDRIEATLSPPTCQRAALSSDAERLSEDLAVSLRRSRRQSHFHI